MSIAKSSWGQTFTFKNSPASQPNSHRSPIRREFYLVCFFPKTVKRFLGFSHDLSPDFTIEAMVSAKRIDAPRSSSSAFQSVANTVSRSFGRRFGANYVITSRFNVPYSSHTFRKSTPKLRAPIRSVLTTFRVEKRSSPHPWRISSPLGDASFV